LRAFVIGDLLVELDRLRFLVSHLHMQSAARGGDGQIAIAEPADQIERLSHRLFVRQALGIVGDVLLDRGAHLRRGAEEAICRHQPRERLVRTLEIVCVDEELKPSLQIGKIGEDRSRQKFVPQRLPKSFDFAERLRMLRATLDMANAFAPQLLLEFRRAAPRRVLPPLIRQNLARSAECCDALAQRFHHQRRALMVRQSVRHDKARMVVHEGRHVDALVAAQEKRENIGLPELIRLGALEAARPVLAFRRPRALIRYQTGFVQNAPDFGFGNAEPGETRE
jgi:hypothetical protein